MNAQPTHLLRIGLSALAAALFALAPGRAAADPAAIFVGNYNSYGNGYLSAYATTGAAATGYTNATGFTNASGVAYNPANNTVYAADSNGTKIRTFNATTGAETSIGFANATGLSTPVGLALNAGVLYVTNANSGQITAYNAATGARVTAGFTSPSGLNTPFGLAVTNTTLYVANYGAHALQAFNLATGTAAAGFTTISNLDYPSGVALYGNVLFVSTGYAVGEYNATTGAVINANFVTGLNGTHGVAILGNRLLVANGNGTTVGAYGIPDVATLNNVPTSANPSFLSGLSQPTYLAVIVPEPGTWTLVALGAFSLGVLAARRRTV